MSVSTTTQAYDDAVEKWIDIRDCLDGEQAVKAATTRYLPHFIPHDADRYAQYVQRASFVNVTGRTQEGLVGAIFRRDPEIELPTEIEYMRDDYDGSGQSLKQLGKLVAGETLAMGRNGMLIDHPVAEEGLSEEQTRLLDLRATVANYLAEDILRVESTAVGGKLVLTMIVLREIEIVKTSKFNSLEEYRYRVLELDEEGKYFQQMYDDSGPVTEPIYPRKKDGQFWDEIPFVFSGSKDNRPEIDKPPMYDLARVNISHYRNSADYEESLHIHGQGTLFVSSELSVEQWREANPNGILVGARTGHFLGSNGSATLLQLDANTAAAVAMEHKEDVMRALGARLISQKGGNQTAEAARIDSSSETSILNNVVGNSSNAIQKALQFACEFMGGNPEEVKFSLNTSFFDDTMTAQDVMAMITLEDRGTIAKKDTRSKLRSSGWIKKERTDEDLDNDSINRDIGI